MDFFIPDWNIFTLDWISWVVHSNVFRSRRPEMFYKKGSLKNFTEKLIFRSLFFSKVASPRLVQNRLIFWGYWNTKKYSGYALSRTPTGPAKIFEIVNVRAIGKLKILAFNKALGKPNIVFTSVLTLINVKGHRRDKV